jgi:hypothetical protein
MAGSKYLKGHASTSIAPGNDTSWSGENAGPYIGVVKNNIDQLRSGRLQVNIPSLSKTLDPISSNLITCEYLSPFYGTKDVRHSIAGSVDYKDSQHSYGFWAVPPDIGTRVLVIFAEGKMDQAFWIGCVPEPMTNQMTPGISSSTLTHDALDGTFEGPDAGNQDDKKSKYGSINVPSGEVNRTNTEVGPQQFNSLKRPIHPFAETLLKQGLSADDIRGNTSSSARRETPSQVFGISTPGRKDETTTKVKVGTKDTELQDYVTRKTGHTFVMDDGAEDGTNQLTRLRTASGHQLLMHDTDGVVYLANGSGKAFIEMDRDGTVSVYSDGGINLRSNRDFNLHSDMNINFHAKGQINFTSETNVALNAEGYLFAMGEKGLFNSSQSGSVRSYAKDGITSFSDGIQLHGAGGRIDLAGSQVHLNSIRANKVWGPSWLNPDALGIKVTAGLIDIDDDNALKKGEPNKIDNRTTVTDFVTHEPYDRQSSTARTKKYINEVMEEIKKSSPELSATELKLIKSELLKQPSIKAVADKLNKVVKSNDKIKLPVSQLNTLVSKANDLQKLFNDPQGSAINFVKGFIGSTSGQAFVNNVFKRVKTFFYGEASNPGDRDTFDPTTGQ